jgi:FixJ family two-component response regulator
MDLKLTPWVAIVDDEAGVRRAVLRLLRSAKIPARSFASGYELLASLPDGAPYCAVIDMQMPGMNGDVLHQHLRNAAPGTHVIYMTAQHSAELEARARRLQPMAYLHKPMDEGLLLQAIAAAQIVPATSPAPE